MIPDPPRNGKTVGIALGRAHSLAPADTPLAAGKALGIGGRMRELEVGMTRAGELAIAHADTFDPDRAGVSAGLTDCPQRLVPRFGGDPCAS